MAKLQAAIALLPDAELSNRLGAASLAAHAASRGRLRWPRLPPHLSLKQPFAVGSLPAVEHAIHRLAAELAPVEVRLGQVEVQASSPGSPEAVVWVRVDAEPCLLELERRVEAALALPATDAALPFVSEAHRFHVTLGFLPAASPGEEAPLASLAGTTATFPELGVLVYDGLPRAGWQCMLFARCSLGTKRAPDDGR